MRVYNFPSDEIHIKNNKGEEIAKIGPDGVEIEGGGTTGGGGSTVFTSPIIVDEGGTLTPYEYLDFYYGRGANEDEQLSAFFVTQEDFNKILQGKITHIIYKNGDLYEIKPILEYAPETSKTFFATMETHNYYVTEDITIQGLVRIMSDDYAEVLPNTLQIGYYKSPK